MWSIDRRCVFVAGAAVLLTLCCVAVRGGSAAVVTASCGRSHYALKMSARRASAGVVVSLAAVRAQPPACSVKGLIRVAIRARDGSVEEAIRNNPASWHVATRLSPSASFVHMWIWRNWCAKKNTRRFGASASLNGKQIRVAVPSTPPCRDRRAASTLSNTGPAARLLPPVGDRIPAHILPPDTPPPVSPALVRVTNAWLVSDGRTLVAVYAGEAGNDPTIGRFVIIRQNLVVGFQTRDVVDVAAAGSIRITDAPAGAAVETSAQRGDLRFSSPTGAQGVLHLATDTVEVSKAR
jgi:hypothetical protein